MTINAYTWEINTHRAIEREAIKQSVNLQTFTTNAGIKNETYTSEKFEGYGNYTYFNYVTNGETNGISTKEWQQTFGNTKYEDLIEAGSILEDAQWPHPAGTLDLYDRADGRFVNHFYDAQNGGQGLIYWGLKFQNALRWATVGTGMHPIIVSPFHFALPLSISDNDYDYNLALEYFKLGFTSADAPERKRYQAKMFVSVGQLMHFMNDMTSPAHTRGDSHQEGDIMEVWGRGGENGKQNMGYKIVGNTLDDDASIIANQATDIPKYSKFSDFITKEATWTATHFFSKDTIYTKPKPSISDTYESFVSSSNEIDKYYIRSYGNGTSSCRNGCVPGGTKLGIKIKSYIIRGLKRYYTGSSRNVLLDKSTIFKGDYSVLKDDAKILIPRAIANARNFLDYFFRGQIEAKIDGSNITIKNISKPNLVKDGHTVTINPGAFYIKYYTTGNVSGTGDGIFHDFEFTLDLARYTQNIALIGTYSEAFPAVYKNGFSSLVTLAPGDSIVVPIKKDTSIIHKNIVVIYDGIIGNEKGLAVCAAQIPSAMSN